MTSMLYMFKMLYVTTDQKHQPVSNVDFRY